MESKAAHPEKSNETSPFVGSEIHTDSGNILQFKDNRPETIQLQKMQQLANQQNDAVNISPNNTGLPDHLKSGIENLSGISMDDVKVHRNSDKPAQLNAHAYAQGADIHLASGQEKHLAHEAWHVVQQKQGRVKPTTQLKGTQINDDSNLEKEADVMGAKALSANSSLNVLQKKSTPKVLQAMWDKDRIMLEFATDKGINIKPPALNAIFENNKVAIIGLLATTNPKQRRLKILQLKTYLDKDDRNYGARYQLLLDYNHVFGTDHVQLNTGQEFAPTVKTRSIVNFFDNHVSAHVVSAGVSLASKKKGLRALIAMYDQDPTFAGLVEISGDIDAKHGDQSHFNLDNTATTIARAIKAVKPEGASLGGMAWGSGGEASIGVNKTIHFKKHCLRIDSNGNQHLGNPDPHEPWNWMQRLGYTITKQLVKAHSTPSTAEEQSIFGAGNTINSQAKANYFFNTFLPGKKDLISTLTILNKGKYASHAAAATVNMGNIYVSLEGSEGFVQGQNGPIFLIGKWDHGFSLSSAYLNNTKIVQNARFKLYDLVP